MWCWLYQRLKQMWGKIEFHFLPAIPGPLWLSGGLWCFRKIMYISLCGCNNDACFPPTQVTVIDAAGCNLWWTLRLIGNKGTAVPKYRYSVLYSHAVINFPICLTLQKHIATKSEKNRNKNSTIPLTKVVLRMRRSWINQVLADIMLLYSLTPPGNGRAHCAVAFATSVLFCLFYLVC